jgi:DNA replication and repair protein RecF
VFLKRIEIEDFRNLAKTVLEFDKQCNFIFGDNAQGKTNLIEAFHLLCLSKSFRAIDDSELLQFNKENFIITGIFSDERNIFKRVGINYSRTDGKKIKVDGKSIDKFSSLLGQFPIVILSSSDSVITTGPPFHRRRFFNVLLCQSFSRYLDDLKRYEKVLKQRNALLALLSKGKQVDKQQLEVWNQQLIEIGSAVIIFRSQIVDEMNKQTSSIYSSICGQSNQLNLLYRPNVKYNEVTEIKEKYESLLATFWSKERKVGMTLVGPHRDDFQFSIGTRDIRRYGSRGEHKTVLISLKAAEMKLLKQRTQTEPILLLDDLYAELDIKRREGVLDLFQKSGQIFVTGTSQDHERMSKAFLSQSDATVFWVRAGVVERQK